MSLWAELRERGRALLFRRSEERDMEEELSFHLDQEIEKNLRVGLSPTEARRRALVAFGGVDRFAEQVREARGVQPLENALRDVRFGLRRLRREPGLTAAAVLSLAVGIGATTTVFAHANWLLLRPVPGVAAVDELVIVSFEDEPGQPTGVSHPNLEDLRAATPALAGLVAEQSAPLQGVAPEGSPFTLTGRVVEGDYFGVLGVRPALGRFFTSEERSPAAAGDVVVISDRIWSQQFGRAPDVIGKVLRLNAETYTVVGVASASFRGVERIAEVDVWLPPAAYGRVRHTEMDVSDRGRRIFFNVIGRLARGASSRDAQEQLRAASRALIEQYPDENGIFESHPPTVYPGIGLEVLLREPTARTLRLLMGVVAVLLLLAAANVANLLLFRGVSRQPETSMRRALGASAGRLIQQQVTEGLLLSLLGGVAGVGAALVLGRSFQGQSLLGLPALQGVAIDWRVVGFGLGGALAAGLLATSIPAVVAVRSSLLAASRRSDRSGSGYSAAARGALTVVQIAASLTLLVGATLLVRTVRNLGRVELGFEPEAVISFSYNAAPQGYDAEAGRALDRGLLERVRAVPGVERASVASEGPTTSFNGLRILSPDRPDEPIDVRGFAVSADYFSTLGIRLLAGRAFTTEEEHAPLAEAAGVVLSAAAASALFGEPVTAAVGRVVEIPGSRGGGTFVVVGVSADFRAQGVRRPPTLAVHLPLGAAWHTGRQVFLRTALPRDETELAVTRAMREIDPGIPFNRVATLSENVRQSIAEERLMAKLLGLFSLLAAALAGMGLYSVIAYSVARQKREIGIRMSLGARRAQVVGLVVRSSVGLVVIGLAAGIGGGYALSRLLASRLFGVTPLDTPTYGIAAGAFMLVALVASLLPASAAARVDPIETLKAE